MQFLFFKLTLYNPFCARDIVHEYIKIDIDLLVSDKEDIVFHFLSCNINLVIFVSKRNIHMLFKFPLLDLMLHCIKIQSDISKSNKEIGGKGANFQ